MRHRLRARTLTDAQTQSLRVLARRVAAHLHLRREVAALEASGAERERLAADLRASEARVRAFMDHTPALAYMKDEDGRFVFVNGQACRVFGRAETASLGRTDAELLGEAVVGPIREIDRQVLATGATVRAHEVVPTPDERSEHWLSDKFRLVDSNGRKFLAGISIDVTNERRIEDALRESETRFRAVVDRLAEGVFLYDPDRGAIIQANAAFLALLGYSHDDLADLTPTGLLADQNPETVAAHAASIRARLQADGRCNLGHMQYRRKDGAVVEVDVRITTVPNAGSGLCCVIVRDVTEQRVSEDRLFAYQFSLEQANEKLRASETTDGLTGLRNRAALNTNLAEECERVARYGVPVSLLLMGVDHFKPFNDKFGHPAGNEVLRAVASELQSTARATDFVARAGGEEFALILPDADQVGAIVLAERCRRAIMSRSWDRRPITVSIGASTLTDASRTPAELLQEADDALYAAKRAGRNRVSYRSSVCPSVPASRDHFFPRQYTTPLSVPTIRQSGPTAGEPHTAASSASS